jgi:hypothetical protein
MMTREGVTSLHPDQNEKESLQILTISGAATNCSGK